MNPDSINRSTTQENREKQRKIKNDKQREYLKNHMREKRELAKLRVNIRDRF